MTATKELFHQLHLTGPPKNNTKVSGPDWLLYSVPSIAFVFGLLLFSLVYRTQRRKEVEAFWRVAAQKNIIKTSTGHACISCQDPGGTEIKKWRKLQNSSETHGICRNAEVQSYENVSALIYSNQPNINCIQHDKDYLSPDADTGDLIETDKTIYLQPLQDLTDTDGESYENMEGCVYAHPRQLKPKNIHNAEDDDYIDPDAQNKPNLEQTDTESYENMDSLACHNTVNTHTGNEGWHSCMNHSGVE